MLDYDALFKLAEECGFTSWGKLDVSTLNFRQEVRDMCAADKCHNYNKSWSCPPACGTPEEMAERAKKFTSGIIVQTVGQMEDSFDFETMQETALAQADHFTKMHQELKKQYPDLFPMGSGGCSRCTKCTYPDAPCRFPELLTYSMEACGLVVAETCTANGVPYNHGKDTICYTGCFLLE